MPPGQRGLLAGILLLRQTTQPTAAGASLAVPRLCRALASSSSHSSSSNRNGTGGAGGGGDGGASSSSSSSSPASGGGAAQRQLKAALRSLYKRVHPDLFHDRPSEKARLPTAERAPQRKGGGRFGWPPHAAHCATARLTSKGPASPFKNRAGGQRALAAAAL
jgi:hypothetical protein